MIFIGPVVKKSWRDRAAPSKLGPGYNFLLIGIFFLHFYSIINLGIDLLRSFTFLLLGQVILAVTLIYKANRQLYFHDVRLIFVGIYSLYGLVSPIGTLYLGVEPAIGIEAAVLLFALGLLGFNIAQLKGAVACKAYEFKVVSSRRLDIILSICLIGTFTWILVLARTLDIPIRFGQVTGSRANMSEINQLWVVTGLAMTGLSCFTVFVFHRLGKMAKIISIVILLGWVLFHLGIGNRRDFTSVLFFIMAYMSLKHMIKMKIYHMLSLTIGLFFFLYLGVIRIDAEVTLTKQQIMEIAIKSNEFSVPIETVGFYATSIRWDLKYGETYFRTPAYIIPRVFWTEKPVSLGIEYLLDRFGTSEWQGYAFTPVTEAYLNFGWIGPTLVIGMFSLFLNYIIHNGQRFPGAYLILFSLMPDINRGEAALILYNYIIIWGTFWLIWKFTGVNTIKTEISSIT